MRISELSTAADVPVATIKYYLREGLLPEGERTAPTQATYGDAHVQRLRVIRALVSSGVSIAETRRVLAALNNPPANPFDVLGTAHEAVTPQVTDTVDLSEAEALAARLGWTPGTCDPRVLASVARALQVVQRAGFEVPAEVMTAYLDGIRAMAGAEIAAVPTESVDAAVRYVVLGTVLIEPLLLALRRVAEQVASYERFGVTG